MTKEEAIICKVYLNDLDKYHTCNEYKLLMQLIDQEPCEDSISRKGVNNLIDDCNSDGLTGIFCSYDDGERFKEYIKNLPSVTPQPKTGHWIEEFNGLEGEVRFTCSSCGKYQLFGTDYCYNCGAKMVDPQESEDKR